MNELLILLNLFNDAIFVSLVNTLWQMTLLIPVIMLIIFLFRIKSSAVRYSLWLFVMFALIILPLITPFVSQLDLTRFRSQNTADNNKDDLIKSGTFGNAGASSKVVESALSGNEARTINKKDEILLINPISVVYFLWFAGVLFMSYVTVSAYRRLSKLRINSVNVEDQETLEMLSQLKQRLNISRPVALKVSSEMYTPISLGVFHTTIILPDSIINSPFGKGGYRGISELDMILTHELAHIKRYDYLISIFQNVLRVIFFFHPLFHLANRNLSREREHICDDWVIGVTGKRSKYAECIVGLLEEALYKPVNVPVVIAMAERKRDIPRRIEMIVDKGRKINTGLSKKALAVMLVIGCLSLPVIGGMELIRFAMAKPASDDGRIAYAGDFGIWIVNADGTNQKQLTADGSDTMPAWSPDGKQIAFIRCINRQPYTECIHIMNSDGTNIRQITNGLPDGSADNRPSWSPDGTKIVFHRVIQEQKDGKWETKSLAIYVVNSDGTNMKKLTESPPFFDMQPSWSPDGNKIVFALWGFEIKPSQVWVMDVDGNNRKMLNDWGFYPSWSPDGKKITFTSNRDAWDAWHSADVYIMDADGGNVKILTDVGPSWDDVPTWSPDGTKIAFTSNRDGIYKTYIVDISNLNTRRLTNTAGAELHPSWTAFSYAVEPGGKLKSTWGRIKSGLNKF